MAPRTKTSPAKPDAKPADAKPAAKPAASAAKPDAQPDAQPDAKPAAKPDAQPDELDNLRSDIAGVETERADMATLLATAPASIKPALSASLVAIDARLLALRTTLAADQTRIDGLAAVNAWLAERSQTGAMAAVFTPLLALGSISLSLDTSDPEPRIVASFVRDAKPARSRTGARAGGKLSDRLPSVGGAVLAWGASGRCAFLREADENNKPRFSLRTVVAGDADADSIVVGDACIVSRKRPGRSGPDSAVYASLGYHQKSETAGGMGSPEHQADFVKRSRVFAPDAVTVATTKPAPAKR